MGVWVWQHLTEELIAAHVDRNYYLMSYKSGARGPTLCFCTSWWKVISHRCAIIKTTFRASFDTSLQFVYTSSSTPKRQNYYKLSKNNRGYPRKFPKKRNTAHFVVNITRNSKNIAFARHTTCATRRPKISSQLHYSRRMMSLVRKIWRRYKMVSDSESSCQERKRSYTGEGGEKCPSYTLHFLWDCLKVCLTFWWYVRHTCL